MMLGRVLMMMLAFLPFVNNAEAGIIERMLLKQAKVAPKSTIKVLVADNKDGVILEVKGRYKLYNPENNKLIVSRLGGKRKYMQGLVDGLKWGEEFPDLHQIMVKPDSPETTITVDGIEYRGSVCVYDVGGYISVVNEVEIEDYITALLAPLYKESISTEALAAVAITARTTALYQSQNPRSAFWAIDAGQVGYQGCAIVSCTPKMIEALNATKHMVLSKAEASSKAIDPFIAGWGGMEAGARQATISLSQAESMAQNGQDAGQILSQAFPGTYIQLMQQ